MEKNINFIVYMIFVAILFSFFVTVDDPEYSNQANKSTISQNNLTNKIKRYFLKEKYICFSSWNIFARQCVNGPNYIVYIAGAFIFLLGVGLYTPPANNHKLRKLKSIVDNGGVLESKVAVINSNKADDYICASISKDEKSYILELKYGDDHILNENHEFLYFKELVSYLDRNTSFNISRFKSA